jgi:polyhydroxyalkanoate synthesis repressor PhaR
MKRKKETGPGSPLLIKRYSNRKLYNTRESRYITLDELADLIKAGTDIRVVDNDSHEDLTSVTLSQILLENERKKRDALPRLVLMELIQKGDQLVDTVKKSITSGLELLTDAESELEKNIRRLVSRGELDAEEGATLVKRLSDWVKESGGDLESRVDRQIQQITRRFDFPAREDMDRLQASIDRLAEAVERLETKRRAGPGGER